jgi:hypothetical protein
MDSKIPKDLGIKIGTKAESLWTKVKAESESLIKQSEDNLIIQKAMLQLAEDNIKAEQSK